MKKLLYLHGFASSSHSGTVQLLRTKLYPLGIQVVAKDIPLNPLEGMESVKAFVEQEQPDLILGTSMGALFAERMHGYKRILVNPAFIMSEACKGMGFGKHEWLSARDNGEKTFQITKALIDQFKALEKDNFVGEMDPENVWAFFGTRDTLVNFQDEFKAHYGEAQFYLFDGEHRLNDNVLTKVILPKIKEIMSADDANGYYNY